MVSTVSDSVAVRIHALESLRVNTHNPVVPLSSSVAFQTHFAESTKRDYTLRCKELKSLSSLRGDDSLNPESKTLYWRGVLHLAFFWFLAGILSTLATLILLLPWLRTIPRLGPLPSLPWQAGIGAVVVMAAVLALYHWFGRSDLAAQSSAAGQTTALPASNAASAPSAFADAVNQSGNLASPAPKAAAGSMGSAIAALEGRLAKGGGAADDWELLAKSYEFLGRPGDASKARARQLPPLPLDGDKTAATPAAAPVASAPALSADSLQSLAKASTARQNKRMKEAAAIYAQLAARGQMNADGWADYADTSASLQGGKLAGEPETYIAKALALDPQHPKALWLKASADEEAARFSAAVIDWQRLQGVLPPNSADAKIVAANLQRDTQAAGAGAASSTAAAGPGTAVSGEVSLAAGLSAKAAAGATLFIVAKSVDSPGVPVAVFRGSVGTWPVKFTLDDSQSMLPGRNLSSAGRVTIEARISQRGQPLPAAGDLQGSSGAINPADHQPLKILIDRII
jgi:cytochrome c-type biogenesis protein CcmH/NrfG